MSRKKRAVRPNMQESRLYDFSGGMNNAVHPAMLNDNESTLIENYSLDEKGTLSPVKGRHIRYPNGVGTAPINGLAEYSRSDGTTRLLIGAGGALYVDLPRLVRAFTTQAEWDTGTVNPWVTTARVSGDLQLHIGKETGIATSTGESTFGAANTTYGWTITPKRNIHMAGFRLRGLLTATNYKLSIWRVSDKSVIRQQTVTATSTTAWESIWSAVLVLLEKDVSYRIGIWCNTANFMRSWTDGTANAELTRGNSFSGAGDIFPETAWATNLPGVDILFDVAALTQITDTAAAWGQGTLTQVETEGNNLRLQTAFAPLTSSMSSLAITQRQA